MKKVLIIEDDVVNIKLYDAFLKGKFEVDFATNGIEGLYFYYKNIYDVIIIDLMMPYMNGYDVLKYIRKLEKPKNKIIVCTALDTNELDRAWCDEILIKPIRRERLLEAIEK